MITVLGRQVNYLVWLAVFVGAMAGFGGSWLYNKPPTPWVNFGQLTATYEYGAGEIKLEGTYHVNRECNDKVEVIWRTEAIATDGQLAVYGPKPSMPSLTVGSHIYLSDIPLLERILPDGWVVRVIGTCPGEKPETIVSPAARVRMIDGDEVGEGRAPTSR